VVSELGKIYSPLKQGAQPALETPESFANTQFTRRVRRRGSRGVDVLGQQFATILHRWNCLRTVLVRRCETASAATLKRDIPESLHLR